MRIATILLISSVLLCGVPSCFAAAFDDEDSGSFKVSLSSLPFFAEPGDDAARDNRRDDHDPDDEEYTTDSLGRKVPARTRKAGTAIRGL